jgi:DNA-binding beta-propeller fold protein YncE
VVDEGVIAVSKDGIFITAWGKHGKGPGEFDTPHGIALDSMGRVYVADRANNRIQISSRTASSLPNGNSLGGRATSPSTRMT